MCGICGFTGNNDRGLLVRCNDAITHRGPDDDGYYGDGIVNLAMRRLSIVDINQGSQPQGNETGDIWVVFNGEIYNHHLIRQGLEKAGHRFKSHHSDTETIVHMYEEYGPEWPQKGKVNGMFAVALWDAPRRRLYLYRDRIGKKPLYYAQVETNLVFGSEIKAVLQHPAVSDELDYGAIYNYFSLKNTSAPDTAYKQVKQLLPGHYLVWDNGTISVQSYWRVDFSRQLTDITEQEAAQEILRLLDDAVEIRMRMDAPYGAYLSGGVDSSSVVTLMCRHQSQPVKTFCLGYAEEAKGQFAGKSMDMACARLMSDRLGTEHHEYILSPQEFADSLPAVMRSFDEPFSGTISTYFLSILIRRHVKVALSGDGADELFGSYLSHRLAWPIHHYLRCKRQGKTQYADLSQAEKDSLSPFDTPEQYAFLAGIAHENQAVWRLRLAVFNEEEKQRLLSGDFLAAVQGHDTLDLYSRLMAGATAQDPLNQVLEIDQHELLANQVLPFMDRLSMAHSVEVRSPFLDYRIIEFVNSLPGTMKIKNGVNKYVHKLAVEPLLPTDILNRPKEGFVQPNYSWMRTILRPWVEDILSPKRMARHGLLRPEPIQALIAAHYSGKNDHSAQIWNLLCFQVWYETLVGG